MPDAHPRILVLEERHDSLYAAARLLKSVGYTVNTVFEEGQAVASVLAAENNHVVLLTARDTTRPVGIPQLIERLRQLRYDRPIVYCAKAKVSPATRAAYEALSVDRVLAVPTASRSTALDALDWVAGYVALGEGGLTILEV